MLALAGCGSSASDDRRSSAANAAERVRETQPAYLFEHLHARTALSSERRFDNLEDLLPNKGVDRGDGQRAVVDRAVIGPVQDVSKGAGFRTPDFDSDEVVQQLDFDDPAAQWKTIHLRVADYRDLSGTKDSGPVQVGIAVGPDADFAKIKSDLLNGRFVFFLVRSPVFAYDDARLGIVADGAMLTLVTDGRLTLPAVNPAEADALLEGTRTEEALVAKSREPVAG
jgi:hypothetical protein